MTLDRGRESFAESRRLRVHPALRTLMKVRVSQINWCRFCVDVNAATALKRDVSQAKLLELAAFAAIVLFSAREKAALAYAEAVTVTEPELSRDNS